MRLKFLSFSNLTLLVALSLSSVAAWYSIIGLTAIFAGAIIPIIIMGSILEVGKITTTVWLRKYWFRASFMIKSYLVFAVFFLAVLTSMGIFGFLSKAHMDQGIVSGDSIAKVALYDEKIAIQKDIVKSSKAMLAQMDQQVNDIMSKGDSEKAVERSVTIRKQQAKERASLQKDIENANKEVQRLNEERAPLAAESRKIEAEVGPIKYIAALIYGDNPDANILEKAVRWVIIMIVAVFDPLALVLVVAANQSKEWDENDDVAEENKLREKVEHEKVMTELESEKPDAWVADVGEKPTVEELEPEKTMAELHPYLNQPFAHFKDTTPIVHKPEEPAYEQDDGPLTVEQVEQLKKSVELFRLPEESKEVPDEVLHTYDDERLVTPHDKKILAMGVDVVDRPGDYLVSENITVDTSMPVVPDKPFKEDGAGYITFEGKHMSKDAFKGMRPDLFALMADSGKAVNSSFGTKFPEVASKGDVFVRVDVLPNKVFKFDGRSWISVNKENSNTYLYNTKYVEFLIDSLAKGEYDADLLSENERIQIEDYLRTQKNNKNG